MMSVMSVISLVYLDTLSEAVVHVVLAPLTRPVQEVEILTPGNQVGAKLGNPVQIGIDGEFPDPVRDKLTALR